MEKAVVGLTKSEFSKRVEPGLLVAKHVGNMYCASLYGGLVSLIGGGGVSSDDLVKEGVEYYMTIFIF